MAPETRPAIDMAHLGTYTQGDRALEGELLNMFLPSAQGYIDGMEAGQGESWWTAAHSLKGVALGVGAWEVAALAEAAEGHRDSPPPVRQDQIEALRSALARVRCFVANLA
jgi:hypothetical protein